MQIVTSWMEEGIERGIERGIEQGIEQGRKQGELTLLNRRFGSLSPQMQEGIDNLPIAQLEELGEALLDFTTIDDLSAWFEGK